MDDKLVKEETAEKCPKLWLAATINDVKSFARLYNQEVVNIFLACKLEIQENYRKIINAFCDHV